jgi:ATP-dependent DNA ligase
MFTFIGNNLEVFDILEDLAANPSRNYKIDKLTEHKDNKVLREVVRLALDPFTQFYIRKIPKYEATGSGCLMVAMDRLFELSSRLVTGHAAIEHLTQVLTSLSPKNAKVLERIIAKDLKCGVSTATANDVWLGLILDYPCMLASQYEQKLVDKIQWPAMVQLKLDGMRFNAIVRDGQCEFKSRNGKTIDLLGNLEQEFVKLSNGMDVVFDGELIVKDDNGIMNRQTGNGILNKAVKGTISDKEAAMVHATIWDHIPYMYFTSGECPTPYKQRFARLETTNKISVVPNFIVDNIEEAQAKFKEYYDQGEEGIILKDMNAPWENKRSKSLIKFKGELECDLKIVDVEDGTGKYEGMLGALVCESEDGIIKVKVGSGFNDEDRKKIKKQDVVGKVVAVKYNSRIRSKHEDESLFLPIFVEIREDKDKADSSGSIK